MRDNLYRARKDGRIEGSQPVYVRRQSLFLEAQKHPVIAGAAVATIGAVALSMVRSRRRQANSVPNRGVAQLEAQPS